MRGFHKNNDLSFSMWFSVLFGVWGFFLFLSGIVFLSVFQ